MAPPERPWQDASAQVFVRDLDHPTPEDRDAHHLGRVLRLRPGQRVCAADGSGRWRPTAWTGDGLEPLGDVAGPVPVPGPPVTVAFAPPKGDRPELVVQKLTELGVDRVVVLAAERSVVRWAGERAHRHLERLARVAREAAMQCRRLTLPEVVAGSLEDLLAAGVALAEQEGRPAGPSDLAFAVGPEGGWSDAELQRATDAGAPLVRLGAHVLRAETAAIVAGALATRARDALVQPPSAI